MPIIARDIHKLRRQGSQPPFSDAYLSGMPTKRRKLIKKNKPDLEQGDKMINGNINVLLFVLFLPCYFLIIFEF